MHCFQDWLVIRKSGGRRNCRSELKSSNARVAPADPGFLYISHRQVLTVRAACNNKNCDAAIRSLPIRGGQGSETRPFRHLQALHSQPGNVHQPGLAMYLPDLS